MKSASGGCKFNHVKMYLNTTDNIRVVEASKEFKK